MTLQLIASEIADTVPMFESVRIMYEQVSAVPEVRSEQDIDILFSSIIKLGLGGIVYPDNVNVRLVGNHANICRRYVDPTFMDDFI